MEKVEYLYPERVFEEEGADYVSLTRLEDGDTWEFYARISAVVAARRFYENRNWREFLTKDEAREHHLLLRYLDYASKKGMYIYYKKDGDEREFTFSKKKMGSYMGVQVEVVSLDWENGKYKLKKVARR